MVGCKDNAYLEAQSNTILANRALLVDNISAPQNAGALIWWLFILDFSVQKFRISGHIKMAMPA